MLRNCSTAEWIKLGSCVFLFIQLMQSSSFLCLFNAVKRSLITGGFVARHAVEYWCATWNIYRGRYAVFQMCGDLHLQLPKHGAENVCHSYGDSAISPIA